MEIRTFIGRKLNYINGIYRRQIELDRYLKKEKDINLTYAFYERPINPIDFISKRFILYPLYSRKQDKDANRINHFTFQYLGDMGHFLDKSRTLITCHDIFTFLERNNLKNPFPLQKYILSGLRKCRGIISISKFTKSELIDKFNVPKEKIVVIKNGMNKEMFYPMQKNDISEIPHPNYKKILHVGSEEYRKDFPTLLKALYLLKKKIKNIKLIRVGSPNYQTLIKYLGLEKDVVYYSDISNNRLREIYNLSDIFIFPSLYEGWGAPGLEAASCGTPVICSDIPIFKEVYNNFPLYFPPRNYKILSSHILNLLKDENLKNDMSKKGLDIVKKYSWKESSEKYLKLTKYLIDN